MHKSIFNDRFFYVYIYIHTDIYIQISRLIFAQKHLHSTNIPHFIDTQRTPLFSHSHILCLASTITHPMEEGPGGRTGHSDLLAEKVASVWTGGVEGRKGGYPTKKERRERSERSGERCAGMFSQLPTLLWILRFKGLFFFLTLEGKGRRKKRRKK